MKLFIVLLLFPLVVGAQKPSNTEKESSWLKDYDVAIAKSKEEKKNLLIYFTGSDWCAPCKKLKKDLFDTEAFATLSKDYVLLYVDIPMNKKLISADQLKHNQKLLPTLNKKGVFPLLKVVSASEKVLGEISGYSMDGKIKAHLDFLKKHKI